MLFHHQLSCLQILQLFFLLREQASLESIETASKELNEVLTPLTQKLYPQDEAGSDQGASEDTVSDENTVDAEYEEVKEEEAKEEK